MQEYLEAGIIVNTHGIGGAMMIKSLCDSVSAFCSIKCFYIKENGRFVPHKVLKSSPHKGMALCHLEGFTSPEGAAKFKTRSVYAKREDIPIEEGAYFVVDLIGLEVKNSKTGKVYGKVKNVINNGASDIYEIECADGLHYLPVVPEFVKEIDPEKGILITPIEGLFNEI